MLGENIRKYRKKKKMTQEDLAKAMGVSQGLVSSWEREAVQLTLPTIKEIAKVLGVTFNDLVGDDDLLPPTPQDTATVYVLDGQPTRGLRDDLSESQDEDIDVLIAAYKRMSSEKKKHFKALALAIADEERKGE